MKNNFRIINFLRKLFYMLFLISGVNLAGGVIFNLMTLIFPNFPFGGLNQMDLFSSANFQAETSYTLLGGEVFKGSSEIVLQLKELHSNEFVYLLFGFINNSVFLLIIYFLFKNAYNLFENLTANFKSGGSFCQSSYLNIRHLGFWMLGLWLYSMINGILFSVFLLNDVVVEGMKINFFPDLSEFGSLLVALIIFAFAEVYRAGVVMQEESELTI